MIGLLAPNVMGDVATCTMVSRKADLIAKALEQQIVEGHRPPGTRLDERSLAEEFGVSRTPIREAIRKLASMGLIKDLGRRGIIVPKPTAAALLDAFLVVAELEGIAARLAAQRVTPNELVLLRDANETCAFTKTVEAFNVANMTLHDGIISASHNKLLKDQLGSARPMTFPYRHHLTTAPGYMARSVIEHAAVIEAIAKGDGKTAQTLMTEHVNLQGEEIINFLRTFD